MQQLYIAGGGVAVLFLVVLVLWRRRTSGARASRRAHEAAQGRAPPVDIGDTVEFGITEFTDHHSGQRVAVGKVEGFVVFADDVPPGASVGDVVRVKILSFNRGQTSADGTVLS
ncbi:TRAM domain-containing protein [Haloarchaeobius sp. HRN-SO-5]|uniref:TRAM domain-containing protein n=1 Tax=Haloarchaeobius sp. HRN-SO-5 TaxID=3446118 RepID=UPI003EB6EB2A